jgi:D-xylose transport system ATP-binding protein
MQDEATPPPLAAMRGIWKHYGGVQALAGAHLEIWPREIHALVGDNAAGKSSLIKILSGAVATDQGEIVIDGRPVHIRGPRDAKALGIETVYQDLALADNLDVPANIFLGRELTRGGLLRPFLDRRRMEEESRRLLARLRIAMPNIRQKARTMSGGQRQCIAIARAVCFDARLVILDEPTAALGVEETRKVHDLIREMRGHGLAVVIICHNLNHVFELADRITVMKTGRTVGTRRTEATRHEEILRMIVTGEDPAEPAPPRTETAAPAPAPAG